MGYRSNNLAVLDDGTSAHSLDDPSCDREKLRVCDLQHDSPVDIIILKIEQQGTIGVIVDEVKEVVTLESDQIEKIAYDSKDDRDSFLCGIGKCDDGLISLLDLNAVVFEGV